MDPYSTDQEKERELALAVVLSAAESLDLLFSHERGNVVGGLLYSGPTAPWE